MAVIVSRATTLHLRGADGLMARLLSSDGGTDTWIATDIGPTYLMCFALSLTPDEGHLTLCHMVGYTVNQTLWVEFCHYPRSLRSQGGRN